jgi:signal transduction histidine kinase
VRSEARWLETVVRLGLPEPPPALLAALRELVAGKRAAGMTVSLTGPAAEPHMAEAAVAALVEASREALTNVAKHAGTSSATLKVTDGGPAGITVEIRDGGRGFDRRAAVAGTGLTRSIRERVALAGGRVVVDSEPGRGTAVRLWVPAAPDGKPS